MTSYLLDTDHLSLYQQGHPPVLRALARHAADPLAVSVITMEEQLAGWLAALRSARDDARRAGLYLRMSRALEHLSGWQVVPYTLSAMGVHAGLLRQRLNVGSNDLKIAAVALDVGSVVVTRNRRDFSRVPNLLLEDWSV